MFGYDERRNRERFGCAEREMNMKNVVYLNPTVASWYSDVARVAEAGDIDSLQAHLVSLQREVQIWLGAGKADKAAKASAMCGLVQSTITCLLLKLGTEFRGAALPGVQHLNSSDKELEP